MIHYRNGNATLQPTITSILNAQSSRMEVAAAEERERRVALMNSRNERSNNNSSLKRSAPGESAGGDVKRVKLEGVKSGNGNGTPQSSPAASTTATEHVAPPQPLKSAMKPPPVPSSSSTAHPSPSASTFAPASGSGSSSSSTKSLLSKFDFRSLPGNLVTELIIASLGALSEGRLVSSVQVSFWCSYLFVC